MTVPEPQFEAGWSRPRLGTKVVAVAIVCAAALVAVMAGGSSSAKAAAKAKPFCDAGSLTVTVFNFSEIPFKGALAGFKKYCPSVKVSYAIQTTSPTYQTALQTQKLSGDLTDIIETYDSLSPTLEVDGVVQPLNPYLNAKSFYPASYWLKGMSQSYIPPVGAQPKSFVGKQFFVPIEADATVFYVNNKDLAAGHFTISPTGHTAVTSAGGTIGNDWTWQQAETVWTALTKGSTYGVCERPDWQAQWNPFIKAEGGTAMGATAPALNTPAAVAAWALLIAPEQNGSAIPFATLQKNGDQCDPSFTSGAAAMSIGVRGDLPSLQAAMGPTNFDVLPIPTISTPSGVVRPTGGGSVGWGLSTGAKHTKQALDFLHYFYSPPGYAAAEKTYGIVPAVTSIAADPKAVWATLPNNPANNGAYTIAANTVQAIAPQAPGTVYSNSQTNIPNAVEAVLGGTSLQSAMDALQKETQADYAGALIPKPAP
jgi:ABC-type glycerol-3-phosphate transport system substrate-binding protein